MSDDVDAHTPELEGFAPVALATAIGYALMAAVAAAAAAGVVLTTGSTMMAGLICAVAGSIGWLLGCEVTKKRLDAAGRPIKVGTLRVVSAIGIVTGAIAAVALASLILATGRSSSGDSPLGLGEMPVWEVAALVAIPSLVAIAVTALIAHREIRPPKLSYTVVFTAEEPDEENQREQIPARRSPAAMSTQAAGLIAATGRAWQQLQPVFADPANAQPDLGDLHGLSVQADALLTEMAADRHPDNEWVYATLYHLAAPLHAMAWAASYQEQAAAFRDLDGLCRRIAGDEKVRHWVAANS